MTIHETLMQGVRSWLKFVASLDDAQVLANDFTGTRQALPYMEVRIDSIDETIGVDEAVRSINEDTDALEVRVRGQRRARVTLRGFGDETSDWVATAAASLLNPITLAYLDQLGLSLRSVGPTVKTSPLVDTAREAQVTRDFELLYTIETDPQEEVALETVSIDAVLESPEGDTDLAIEEPEP